MTLDNARKLLKISGILLIIGSIVSIVFGVGIAAGFSYATANMPEMQSNPEYVKGGIIVTIAGILTAISGVIHFLQGFFSLRASGNDASGKNAYNFSIIGLVATAITACTTILGKNVTKASIIGSVLGVVVSILVMLAAKTVKDHYKA